MHRGIIRASLVLAVLALAVSPLRAETRIEKTLKLSPGGDFRLETDLGRVTVTGTSEEGVHIVVTSRHKDLNDVLTFRWEEGAGSATVVAKKKHAVSWFSNGGSIAWEIRVPAETRLSIDTSGGSITVSGTHGAAKLDTSGGGIDVHDLVGDLDADTSGGSITLKGIQGRIRAETSGGGIEGSALDGPVHAESSGGSIDLDGVTGDLVADTSGGSIRIAGAGGRVQADTSGGGIEASFARGNSRGGSLETSGGGIHVALGNSVETDLPIQVLGKVSRDRLNGTLGKGGNTLRLHTSGGGVHIRPL
jgi:DUF4097 and DUF4098 domain-containing protein YvlB